MIDADRDPMPFTAAELRVLHWGDRGIALYGVKPPNPGGCGSLAEAEVCALVAEGLSSAAIAERAGVHRNTVNQWKRNQRLKAAGMTRTR
jgi:hypothetical protein